MRVHTCALVCEYTHFGASLTVATQSATTIFIEKEQTFYGTVAKVIDTLSHNLLYCSNSVRYKKMYRKGTKTEVQRVYGTESRLINALSHDYCHQLSLLHGGEDP